MGRLSWTTDALADVRRIRTYVASDRPLAAERLAERLVSAAEALTAAPNLGRLISQGRRELTVVPPYLIRYRVEGEQVLILEVRHGAREPDTL